MCAHQSGKKSSGPRKYKKGGVGLINVVQVGQSWNSTYSLYFGSESLLDNLDL